MNDYYTQYTPDLNVGIDKLILGETTISSHLLIRGSDLNEKSNNYSFNSKFEFNKFYPKQFDKNIFEENPSLEFDTPDNSLTRISCRIKNHFKNDILLLLKTKYGQNRNKEWKAKGIYRTEINNKYGVIHIMFNEFERPNFDVVPITISKELSLEMYFFKIKMSKIQLDKTRQTETDRIENENKINNSLKRLFDIE